MSQNKYGADIWQIWNGPREICVYMMLPLQRWYNNNRLLKGASSAANKQVQSNNKGNPLSELGGHLLGCLLFTLWGAHVGSSTSTFGAHVGSSTSTFFWTKLLDSFSGCLWGPFIYIKSNAKLNRVRFHSPTAHELWDHKLCGFVDKFLQTPWQWR